MKKLFGILLCMLVIFPVVSMANGENTTKSLLPQNTMATVDVGIYDFYFSPTPVSINVGDTVKWTNNGAITHSSTSDTNIWDSGLLSPGQSFSYTFMGAGSFSYHCSVHPYMLGTVVVSGGNQIPNAPSTPSGPTSLTPGQSGSYSTSATDADGDQVQIRFDWDSSGSHDYSAWSSLVNSGTTVTMSHSYNNTGTYLIKAQAMDSQGASSTWSTGLTVIVSSGGNQPPNTPMITNGPTSGNPGTSYQYTAVATEPEGENIAYYFNWGDGTNSGWTSYVSSGTSTTQSHTFMMSGTYTIQVKAKDINNLESGYASLTVSIQKSRSLNNLFIKFIDMNPQLFQIIKHLLGI